MRRRRAGLFLLVILMLGLVPAGRATGEDAAIYSGDFPDPFVFRDGGQYVAVGTGRSGRVLVSNDLSTWTPAADALARRPEWAGRGALWAPAVARIGETWLMYYALPHGRDAVRCVGVAVASASVGPYDGSGSEPLACAEHGGGAIDPEVFVDGDGTRWLLWKTEELADGTESALWSQRLSADGLRLVGPRSLLLVRTLAWEHPTIENPSMTRLGGRLALLYSGARWSNGTYAIGAAWCDTPAGPCRRTSDRPVLASGPEIAGPGGQAAVVDDGAFRRIALHGWSPDAVGYESGGRRAMYMATVQANGGGIAIGASPMGAVDEVTRADGALRARGWAADPDVRGAIDVHVYVDGVGLAAAAAAAPRPDVDAAHPGLGVSRGYDVPVRAGPGPHVVCVYGIDAGLGENRLIGCRPV